jgi:hypothetical protein
MKPYMKDFLFYLVLNGPKIRRVMIHKLNRRFLPISLFVLIAVFVAGEKFKVGFGVPVTREWLLEHSALVYGLMCGWIIRSFNIRTEDWKS